MPDSARCRLNRSEAFKAVLSSPLAILLPHLRGPAGLPGTSGQRGENGDAGKCTNSLANESIIISIARGVEWAG